MSTPDTPFRSRLTPVSGGSRPPQGATHAEGPEAGTAAARPIRRTSVPQQTDLTLDEVVGRLRLGLTIVRNRWFTALLAAAIAGGGVGYLLLREKPEHTAVTTMLAQSTLDEILASRDPGRERKESQENTLENHLSVMKSRRFSVKLAEEFTPEEKQLVMGPYLEPGETVADASFEKFLASKIGVERERNRDFFTLSFRHRDPDIAVMVANRMTSAYLKIIQDEIQQANLMASGILKVQADNLKEEITRLEDEQRDFRKRNQIISVEENQGILAERLRRIDQQLANYRVERVKLETQLAKAREDLDKNPLPFDNTLLANFGNNQQMRQDLDRLTAQRQILSSRYGSRHAKMREIDASIRGTRETITKNFQLALHDLESQYANARMIEGSLAKEFDEAFDAVIEVGKRGNRLELLESEVTAKREALASLLRRVNNANLVSNIPSDVMRVIDPAYISWPAFSPKVLAIAAISLFAGLAFIITPLILHLFDQRITSSTDIERELGVELLGGIPRLGGVRVADRPHVVQDHLLPQKIEPFMSITAQLELISSQPRCRTFLVTSAVPGEGKSMVVSNLAAAFTKIGRRTLIVDCDLRRPTQHLLHRTDEERGLMAWAQEGFPMQDLFSLNSPLGVRCLPGGTHLIGAGGEDPQPMQYLISSHTIDLLEELKNHYDTILIDTPPAGLFQDALVLTRTTGETLFIAREAYAPLAQIRRSLADLRKTAAPPLGLVLNDFSASNLNPRLAYSSQYKGYRYKAPTPRSVPRKRPQPGALT